MNEIDKTNLGYLDLDFQYKLIKCFMEDPSFFSRIFPMIDQNSFTDAKLRVFVGTLKDYYSRENVVPSYSTLGIALKEKAKTKIDIEEWNALTNKLHNEISFEGYTLVEDTAIKFFKQQAYTKIANSIIEHLKSGDLDRVDECKEMFAKAEMLGQEDEYGYSPYDLIDEALNQEFKIPIPTGISKLDELMNGGLEKKKVGLIIGSAGFGKTSLTTSIASYASTYECQLNNYDGYKVLQIYFEDEDVDITKKHFSKITQIEARKLTWGDKAQIDEVREKIVNYDGKKNMSKNLRLKHFPTGQVSATDIAIFIRKLINSGFKPDLVIIDYFECLAPEKGGFSSDTAWDREGRTMRRIENMAKELDVAIWVPTQGNKGSINSADVVTMDQAGGSIKKVQVAQVVISIARSLDDIDNSKATLAILKNRSGKSGNVFHNITFNNGTSTISCDDVEEYDNTLEWKAKEEELKDKNRMNTIRSIQGATQKNGKFFVDLPDGQYNL